jgi:hypothetical protein
MFSAFVLAVVFAPPILSFLLRKTLVWWLPSFALCIGGAICVTQLDTKSHDEAGVLAGLGNFMMLVTAGALVLYGIVLLLITAAARRSVRRPTPPPPPQLPVATVVAMSDR